MIEASDGTIANPPQPIGLVNVHDFLRLGLV